MISISSSYWPLENKDNIIDSENNDYQVQKQNFIISSPLIYKNQNQNNIIEKQGRSVNEKKILQSSLINNINFNKDFNNSNIKKLNTNIELKMEDNNKIENKNPFVINKQSISKEIKDEFFLGRKHGRKKRDDNSKRVHNKYSNDNIRRKIKHLVLKSFVSFFNEKIKEIYKGDIGQNILKKELLPLNKGVKFESSVKFNQILLERKLKDIYSENITTRFTNFPLDHNIKLIHKLINEKEEEKRHYFINLFNLTFLDCLNHYRGAYTIEELKGMKCFKEVQNEFDNDQDYKTILQYHLNNFDKTLKIIKPRKPKKMRRNN